MRLLRGLTALAWLILLVAGLPAALIHVRDWYLPRIPLTDGRALLEWLAQPASPGVSTRTVYALLAGAAWVLWLWLLYAVVADIYRRLHTGLHPERLRDGATRFGRRLRASSPVQAAASGLIGAVVVGLTAGPAHADTTASGNDRTTPPVPPPAPATQLITPTPEPPESPQSPEQPAAADGVTLPDGAGWLTPTLVNAILATTGLLWLHRRRRHHPGQTALSSQPDPDLAPVPATVALIQRLATGDVDQPPASPPASMSRLGLLGLDQLPDRLTLTGPGAVDACRGLTVAALLADLGDDIDTAALDALATTDPAAQPNLGVRLGLPDGRYRHIDVSYAPVCATRLPDQVVWHVDTDGHATAVDQPAATVGRLTVLNATSFADLVLLRQHCAAGNLGNPTTPAAGPSTAPTAGTTSKRTHQPLTTAPPHPAGTLHVIAFGEPGLAVVPADHPGPPQRLPIPRTAAVALLAYLTVHRDGADRDDILDVLWPHTRRTAAIHRLHTAASAIRHATRATDLHTDADGDIDLGLELVRFRDGRYQLNPDLYERGLVQVDLWIFDTAIEEAAVATDPDQRRAARRQAAALYRGDLAAHKPWPWIEPEREHRRRQIVNALAQLADAEPDPTTALTWLRTAIRHDPINEELHRRTMRAHARAGHTSEVQVLYENLVSQLAATDEVPEPATTQLAKQLTEPSTDTPPVQP